MTIDQYVPAKKESFHEFFKREFSIWLPSFTTCAIIFFPSVYDRIKFGEENSSELYWVTSLYTFFCLI